MLNEYNYGGPIIGVSSRSVSLGQYNVGKSWQLYAFAVNSKTNESRFVPVPYDSSKKQLFLQFPTSDWTIRNLNYYIYRNILPSNGTYYLNFTSRDADVALSYYGLIPYLQYAFESGVVNGITGIAANVPSKYLQRSSSGSSFSIVKAPFTIENSPSRMSIVIPVDWENYPTHVVSLQLPLLSYEFGSTATDPLTPSTPPQYNTPSSGDIQQDISDSVSQIPGALTQVTESLDYIGASLRDIIETISRQLNALWNQMYNLMHVPLMSQIQTSTDEIVDAINDIDVQVSSDFSSLISNDNKNHQEQLAADKANTDQITNGYDNSGMLDSNKQLSDSLTQYEEKEKELLDSVQGNIDNFKYENPFDKFIKPLNDVTFLMNGIYNNLGSLSIPIAFSLTLSIALVCIGWYRFRSG